MTDQRALPIAHEELLCASSDALQAAIRQRAADIARLGAWPAWIQHEETLIQRIPTAEQTASGFDAGIACALGLLPPHARTLSATLHAAYTPPAVAEVRSAIHNAHGLWRIHDADSPACWWLAACSICTEGDDVDLPAFHAQIADFMKLRDDAGLRRAAAEKTLQDMCGSFSGSRGYAFGTRDGCLQGAYIAGHDFAVMHAQKYGVYFIGTFHPSLGLEDFIWGSGRDGKDRPTSGPVHGSRQFVKCADESELACAIAAVSSHMAAYRQALPSAGAP